MVRPAKRYVPRADSRRDPDRCSCCLGTLIASFVYAFRPSRDFPLDVRFTSAKDVGLAIVPWFGMVGAALALYLLLSPVTGGLAESARQSLSVATDVKRLSGQPATAWAVAILRGCLIVPV